MKLVVVDAPQLSTLGVYLNIGHCNQEEAHDVEGSRHRMKSKRNLYATRYVLHIKVAERRRSLSKTDTIQCPLFP